VKFHNKISSGFKLMFKIVVLTISISCVFSIATQTTFAASCSELCASQNLQGACDTLNTCATNDDGTCNISQIKTRLDQADDCETVCYCYEVKQVEDPCLDVDPTPMVEPTIQPTVEPTPTDTPSEECDPHTVECPQTWTFMVYLLTASDEQMHARAVYDGIKGMNIVNNPIMRCANFVVTTIHNPLNRGSNNCSTLHYRQGESNPTETRENCPDLGSFIINAQNSYPSDNYSLTIVGHGLPTVGIGLFNRPYNSYTHEQMREIINSAVAQTGRRINIVEHEACGTGIFENAHSLNESVDYFIAAPNLKAMYPTKFFAQRFTKDNLDPCHDFSAGSLASHLGNSFCNLVKDNNIAVNVTFDLNKSDLLANKIDNFFGFLGENCSTYKSCAQASVSTTQRYQAIRNCPSSDPLCNLEPNVDLIDLVQKIINRCAHLPANSESVANEMIDTAQNMVDPNCLRDGGASGYNYDNAHGVAVYIPRTLRGYPRNTSQFTRESDGWWSFLQCVLN
jgi:hypothetical protein